MFIKFLLFTTLSFSISCTTSRERSNTIRFSYERPSSLYLNHETKTGPLFSVRFIPGGYGYTIPWLYSYDTENRLKNIEIVVLTHHPDPKSLKIDHIILRIFNFDHVFKPDAIEIVDSNIIYARYYFNNIDLPITEDGDFDMTIILNNANIPERDFFKIDLPVSYRVINRTRINVSVFPHD